MESYTESQFNKLGDDVSYKLKITSVNGETKWLQITPQEMEQIKEILL